jgi:hypothetical protein
MREISIVSTIYKNIFASNSFLVTLVTYHFVLMLNGNLHKFFGI